MAETEDIVFTREQDRDDDTWDDSAIIKAYDKAISSVKENLVNDAEDELKSSEEVADENKPNGPKKSKKKRRDKKPKSKTDTHWQVGDRCECIFSEDGLPYAAVIRSINTGARTCVVRYAGYGNTETQHLSDLMRQGGNSRQRIQSSNAENDPQSDSEAVETSSAGRRTPISGKGRRRGKSSSSGAPPPPSAPFPFIPPMIAPSVGNSWTEFLKGMPNASMGAVPPPPAMDAGSLEKDEDALHAMLMAWYMSGYHTGYYHGLKANKNKRSGGSRRARNSSK